MTIPSVAKPAGKSIRGTLVAMVAVSWARKAPGAWMAIPHATTAAPKRQIVFDIRLPLSAGPLARPVVLRENGLYYFVDSALAVLLVGQRPGDRDRRRTPR